MAFCKSFENNVIKQFGILELTSASISKRVRECEVFVINIILRSYMKIRLKFSVKKESPLFCSLNM